jgi:hypothetical protein
MTWRGCDPAIEMTSIEDVRAYIRSLNYGSWRPSNFVVHNTASPTLYQWWNSVPPAERMENLRHYYENEMGWSAGPHAFIDGKSWWIFTPFNVKGVHSPSWNGTMLGFECVGDYNTESDETGMGAEVMRMAHALSGEVCNHFGWDPNNLKFHKEDPNTDHDCPGKNMSKPGFISDVEQYMGDGGEAEQAPVPVRRGTVYNLLPGDKLNIRASASSSAPIIGEAVNGDELIIVGEAWNASTLWLRFQVGRDVGAGVAVYGWCSAAYVDIEAPPPPPGALSEEDIGAICDIANASDIADYAWNDRGVAPMGYTQGMALAFAQSMLKLRTGHQALVEMAKARTDSDKDALNIYREDFERLGMSVEEPGLDTLRHLYALMLGHGMRESSGRHCEGRDISADNMQSDTAEAGLFQTSFNAHSASDPAFSTLMAEFADPANVALCYLDQFNDGVSCDADDWSNYGSGSGYDFQKLCKSCPAFAVESCGLTLRNLCNHYGPIIRKETELRSSAAHLFRQVQDYMERDHDMPARVAKRTPHHKKKKPTA